MIINLKQLFKNNKTVFIILIFIILFIFIILYFKVVEHKNILGIKLNPSDENLVLNEIDLKNDSLNKLGFCAIENIVITDDAPVRRTANYAKFNSVYNLKFGTVIYTKNIDKNSKVTNVDQTLLQKERRTNYVAIYALKPIFLSDKPVGYMLEDDFIEKSAFKDYVPKPKEIPSLPIDNIIKSAIEENLKIENETFQYAKDVDRYNKSIIYSDFNNDGKQDFAIILDNFELINSGLFVYFKNIENDTYDLIYKKSYPSFLSIKQIPKETKVIVNNENTTFPLDGFQITNTNSNTYFYIYNDETKSFMVFQN